MGVDKGPSGWWTLQGYKCIIDLDNMLLISVIWVSVREVRKGRSLIDLGIMEAINGLNYVVFALKLFFSNQCIGQRGTYEALVEPSRITGSASLIARVDGSITYLGSERHQAKVTPSNFSSCQSRQP